MSNENSPHILGLCEIFLRANNPDSQVPVDGYNQKLLCIHIVDKLSCSFHIDNLCSTISSKISLLKQLSKYVSNDVQKKFYQGYILPLIDYGSVVWGTTSSSNIERISKLQKRAARIILHVDLITQSAEMFEKLSWLPILKRLKAVFTI